MISLVVPVFNEVGNLAALHAEICAALDPLGREFEVIYVDDGSRDGSRAVLETLQSADPRAVIVELRRNFGQTAAIMAGFDNARGNLIVTLDADRQNDPADIPAMLAEMERGCDVVAGWRHPRHDAYWTRLVPSWLANRLISSVTGVRLHDYGCTLKVMRREVVSGLRLYGEMHRFIPALASDGGAAICEIKVHHRPRLVGVSKYGLSRTFRVVLDLITVKFLSSYSTRPIHIFGGVGLLAGGVGLAITGVLGLKRMFFGVDLGNRPLLWLGILLTLMGMQFVTMGLLGELLVRTYHESQNKAVYRVARIVRADRN